jgi:hypothetical protein
MYEFSFNISTKIWDLSNNIPKRYPINNISNSFQNLLITEYSNSGTTSVIIQYDSFIDISTNDGLSFNSYTIPYYNDPTFIITKFGGIPFTRNSAINTFFLQGYEFGGKIDVS